LATFFPLFCPSTRGQFLHARWRPSFPLIRGYRCKLYSKVYGQYRDLRWTWALQKSFLLHFFFVQSA
jgi:hypothetical protein